jgi:hypothetical protein
MKTLLALLISFSALASTDRVEVIGQVSRLTIKERSATVLIKVKSVRSMESNIYRTKLPFIEIHLPAARECFSLMQTAFISKTFLTLEGELPWGENVIKKTPVQCRIEQEL